MRREALRIQESEAVRVKGRVHVDFVGIFPSSHSEGGRGKGVEWKDRDLASIGL